MPQKKQTQKSFTTEGEQIRRSSRLSQKNEEKKTQRVKNSILTQLDEDQDLEFGISEMDDSMEQSDKSEKKEYHLKKRLLELQKSASLTEQEIIQKRQYMREYQRIRRARETEEEKRKRLNKIKDYEESARQRRKMGMETEQDRARRLADNLRKNVRQKEKKLGLPARGKGGYADVLAKLEVQLHIGDNFGAENDDENRLDVVSIPSDLDDLPHIDNEDGMRDNLERSLSAPSSMAGVSGDNVESYGDFTDDDDARDSDFLPTNCSTQTKGSFDHYVCLHEYLCCSSYFVTKAKKTKRTNKTLTNTIADETNLTPFERFTIRQEESRKERNAEFQRRRRQMLTGIHFDHYFDHYFD